MDGQRDERPDPELLLKQNFPRESDKARGRKKETDGLEEKSAVGKL